MASRLSVDLAPLRQSRDLRLLYAGRAVSNLGNAVTAVAAAVQVYDLTRSSLAVGALSVAEAVPMVAAMLVGGALADAFDRRRLILVPQLVAGVLVAGLALNAGFPHPRLWLVYVLLAASGAALGLGAPARSAALPSLVTADLLPAAVALNSTVNQVASLVGPALGGLIVARFGLTAAFWGDVAGFGAYALLVACIGPLPPRGVGTRPGLRSFVQGLSYVRHHGLVVGLLLIDVDAMLFGMPKALFPAIGTVTFHGGPAVVGLLYAAPAAGALVAAATSGWISAVRRAGPVLLASVMVWGAAIAAFGFTRALPVALILLAVAGAADLVSEVLRSSLLQLSVPDSLRGRLTALWLAQANGAPALGNLEAGAVATITSPAVSVISGGLACILGAALLARLLPALRTARLPYDLGNPGGESHLDPLPTDPGDADPGPAAGTSQP